MAVLLTIAVLQLAGSLVPGPNVLAVSQTAVGSSRRAALAVALGVAAAAMIWAATAAAGLELLLSHVGGVAIVLRVVGAAILIVLGARLIANREAASPQTQNPSQPLGYFFLRGIVVNLSNPKSLVYYTSVFTALIPADASPAIRLAAVVIVVTDSVLWNSLLALLLSRDRPRHLSARVRAWFERTVGGIFVLFGARLLWGAAR